MNLNAITKALNNAYDAVVLGRHALTSFKASVDTLRPLLKDVSRDEAKAVIAPMWAAFYGETYADGKWANSKCAAKRDCNRLLASIYPSSPATSSKTVVKLSRVQKAAVKALLEAFGGDAKAAKAALAA
jgi:hypothetical protein